MAEQDELRLTITAVDQASPVLKDLQSQIAAISGGAAKQNLEVFRNQTVQTHAAFKTFGEDIKKASEQIIPPFVRGIGGIATAFVGVAFAAERGLNTLKEWAKETSNVAAAAAAVGSSTAEFRSMIEAMRLSGVEAADAEHQVSALNKAWAEMQVPGSRFVEEMVQKAGPFKDAMIAFIQHAREAHISAAEFGNEIARTGEEIAKNRELQLLNLGRGPEEAKRAGALAREHWEEGFGAPGLYRLPLTGHKFEEVTEAQKKAQEDRDKAADNLLEKMVLINVEAGKLKDILFADFANSPLKNVVDWVAKKFREARLDAERLEVLSKQHPAPPGFWEKLYPFNPQQIEREKALHPEYQSDQPPLGPAIERLRKWYESGARLGGLPQYQEGGFVTSDTIAQLHAGEIIHPREGADAMKEQTKQTRELSEQMKRLNDWLMLGVGGYGAAPGAVARMGGLAPGYGVGPASGLPASGVPYGSDVGPGSGAGAGATPAGRAAPLGGLPGLRIPREARAPGLPSGARAPRAPRGGDGGDGAGEAPDYSGEGGSKYLQEQRAPFVKELENDPALKRHLAGLAAAEHESDATAVVESLYNRTAFVNEERAKKGLPPVSLRHMIGIGDPKSFYGPERTGHVPVLSGARLERMEKAIDAAAKSNLLKGATDQGSGRDPNVYWPGGKIVRGGETYNDWGAYGHEAARKFREAQQAAVARGGTVPSIADLTKRERDATRHQVDINGNANVNVKVDAPRGTRATAKSDGVFKRTRVERQIQMEKAASSVPYEE
jgi:hypothetical protein